VRQRAEEEKKRERKKKRERHTADLRAFNMFCLFLLLDQIYVWI